MDLLEIRLERPEDFLKIKETLTRVGVATERDGRDVLTQACHILHKKGRYYVVHFREMLVLDGAGDDPTPDELAMRNTVAFLLDKWNLCRLVDTTKVQERLPHDRIRIVPHRDKDGWLLESNYTVGVWKNRGD